MSRVPTIKDVAKLAGVSVSSVSRYINNPDSVNPLTATDIETAIKELQYVPNLNAQNLRRGNNKTIGVIVPDLGPFFSKVCMALSDYFYKHQHLLYICNTDSSVEREMFYISTLLSQQITGLVIAPADLSLAYLKKINNQFSNLVMIEQSNIEIKAESVYEEDVESTYQLVKHLINAGHRRFQFFFRREATVGIQNRYAGTKRALEEAGMNIDEMQVFFGIQDRESIQQQISKNMEGNMCPTAIVGFAPQITENITIALRQLNYRIPEDVAVAGFVMEEYAMKYNQEIPCVIQRPYELGSVAGNLLMKRINAKRNIAVSQVHCLKTIVQLPKV